MFLWVFCDILLQIVQEERVGITWSSGYENYIKTIVGIIDKAVKLIIYIILIILLIVGAIAIVNN